jgi:hypothetical protein
MELFQTVVRGNRRVGAFAAVKINNIVGIGWAKCKKGDKFDKKLARHMCIGRAACKVASVPGDARNNYVSNNTVPVSLKHAAGDFIFRCKKYYQDAELFVIA